MFIGLFIVFIGLFIVFIGLFCMVSLECYRNRLDGLCGV